MNCPNSPGKSLEVLRQPLEDGQITISRAAGSATYPSRFQLVAAMNPCKCGYYGHPSRACTCSPNAVRQYRSRISGPLLDRIDLCVEMDPISFNELHGAGQGESSAVLRRQVLAARALQTRRFAARGYAGIHCNAQLTAGQVRQVCRLTPAAQQVLRAAYNRLGLSARSPRPGAAGGPHHLRSGRHRADRTGGPAGGSPVPDAGQAGSPVISIHQTIKRPRPGCVCIPAGAFVLCWIISPQNLRGTSL